MPFGFFFADSLYICSSQMFLYPAGCSFQLGRHRHAYGYFPVGPDYIGSRHFQQILVLSALSVPQLPVFPFQKQYVVHSPVNHLRFFHQIKGFNCRIR